MTDSIDATADSSAESPFEFADIFFSRTDAAGIIRSGNSVFQRVSAYSWEEMLGKPHKLIRHPDMPRAVFWLLWDTIKRGEPIGAYVKNRAKDGRYYWVFAIVTPVNDGYLSVRIKPGSDLFSVVRDEYQKLATVEKRENMAPSQSAGLLLARLSEFGFADYGAFMSAALSAELRNRDGRLKRPCDRCIDVFDHLAEAARTLIQQADAISQAYERNAYVPFNFKIKAVQLGRDGASIGEISDNYNTISRELTNVMSGFVGSARQVLQTIGNGLFLTCTAKVQHELSAFFRNETAPSGLDCALEEHLLDRQERIYRQLAAEGLAAIAKQAELFRSDCVEMRRAASGLEVTRIMGKMECARVSVAGDGLNELLEDLESFQKAIAQGLKEIDRMNDCIQRETGKLLSAA